MSGIEYKAIAYGYAEVYTSQGIKVTATSSASASSTISYEDALNKAQADLHHFKKLQSVLPKGQEGVFDVTILQVKNKISEIEKKMADISVLETA